MSGILSNLVNAPMVQWHNSKGTVLNTTDILSFQPLSTSHGGEYTCQANISIPSLDTEVIWSQNTTLIAHSQYQKIYNSIAISKFSKIIMYSYFTHHSPSAQCYH